LPYFKRNGKRIPPPHGRTLNFQSNKEAAFAACLINSSLFYWYYSIFADCEHINDVLVRSFPVPSIWAKSDWNAQYSDLEHSMKSVAIKKKINTKQGHVIEYEEMNAPQAKAQIDQIDLSLASIYALSKEEIDFIVNYDIKYRMGRDSISEEEVD
jgi:hypothetical protein